ncbi:MAG: DUF3102 domain-containing protein [Faecousia sp.]
MSEIVNVPMSQQRDIQTVTTEIRTLTRQGQRLILEYAIEIGRRLREAKSMLPHGEWGKWLREEVEFSQSSANNFMRMFDEYGADQISIFGAEAKSQTIGNLPYTKALKLLALPAEEREEFVQNEDVEHMSSRELEKAIRERDEARKQAQDAETRLSQAQKNLADAQEDAASVRKKLEEARKSVREADDEAEQNERLLKEKLEEATRAMEAARKEAEEAKKQMLELRENRDIPPETLDKLAKDAETAAGEKFRDREKALKEKAEASARKAADAEAAVTELKKKLATAAPETAQFKLMFEQVQTDFNRLLGLLLLIGQNNQELEKQLRRAILAVVEEIRAKVEKNEN